ncbi:energy transducer TonB [Candidatus Nitrospira salsa]
MVHVTPPPSSKPHQWNVSLVKPMPSPQPPQPSQTVKRVKPTQQAPAIRPQPKKQIAQRQLRTQQSITHQVVHRPLRRPVTTPSAIPQQSLPKPMEQTAVRQSPSRKVTTPHQSITTRAQPVNTQRQVRHATTVKTTNTKHSKAVAKTVTTVQTQSSAQQTTPVRTSPKQVSATSQVTVAKAISQPSRIQEEKVHSMVQPHSAVERPLSRQQGVVAKSNTQQQRLKPAIFSGSPDRQVTRRLSSKAKPVSAAKPKIASRPKPSKNTRVTSNTLSPEVLDFLKLLRKKIQRHREYPRIAKRLGYHGVTTVAFSLSQGGDLTLLKVSEPSGHSILDEAALDAIKKVIPMKPPSMMGNAAIEIPVSFELRR